MSKISNYQTALRLSEITGRPLEEFYNGVRETVEDKQEEEIPLEEQEVQCSDEFEEDISEIQDIDEETVDTNDEDNDRPIIEKDDTTVREDDVYTVKYGGSYSSHGKLINHTKEMTNAEYKSITRKMTQKQLYDSPLLFVLFRAEGQVDASFSSWIDRFPKE